MCKADYGDPPTKPHSLVFLSSVLVMLPLLLKFGSKDKDKDTFIGPQEFSDPNFTNMNKAEADFCRNHHYDTLISSLDGSMRNTGIIGPDFVCLFFLFFFMGILHYSCTHFCF